MQTAHWTYRWRAGQAGDGRLVTRPNELTGKDAMPDTTYSLAPLWAEIRADLRARRAAQAARREFRRQLAAARTPADLSLFLPR
jgi:hypothetical protein